MFANFYDKDDMCLYSYKASTEKFAENLADHVYKEDPRVADWTWTNKPISERIYG